ncbi:phage tail spike protein, partial [Leuconostoc mesenteroides]|uniref:phage tail spike protein n=1 Tax=Leuconostoc mesenteroides TaxID=1245 RepID=UPI002360C5AF
MIYIFDKTQAIIKVLTNDDFTAAHLNFKINTATTFEFSLPASKALPSGSKYVATPHPLNDSKFIMLRLTERVDNTETIDYSAYELAYQELATDGYIEDKRPHNQSALNLMKIALDGSNWELNNVNVSGTATTNFYYVDRLSAISKVVDLLGGEIVFYIEIQGNAISGRYMDYLARQGADTSKVFASGSNLLTVERQSDTSGIYTAILPRGKGEEIDDGKADTPDGYGRRINISDVEWKRSAGKPLDKPKGSIVLSDPDATAEWGQINGNARLLLKTYDDIDDVNVLINSAYKTLQSVNHPQIQYSATVADVGGLALGDTVLIMHGDRDLSYKTRVFEVKYDLLSPDQTELSLGDDLSSNSITSHINNLNAVADTTSSQTQWTINQIGRPGTTYGATAPDSPKVGDIWFKYLADGGTEIHRWNGNIWELLASPTTADDIAKAVDDAVAQAHKNTAKVIEENNISQQRVMSDVAKEQADLAIKDGDFNNKAQSMADKALADAKVEAVQVAQEALKSANKHLDEAKKELMESVASEASARNEAIAHVNSHTESILSDAKKDLTESIAKEVSDRASAVDAANSLAQTYANQAKSDINDTINALSVGGRNYLAGTANEISTGGRNWDNQWSSGYKITLSSLDALYKEFKKTSDYFTLIFDWVYMGTNPSGGFKPQWDGWPWDIGGTKYTTISNNNTSGTVILTDRINNSWSGVSDPRSMMIRFDNLPTTGTVTISNMRLMSGNMSYPWTPAPEDVVLDYTTKDNKIKETITQYQETNDGKVSKAQTDATTALGQIETKVSQTDYDQKTGELSTKINETKDTADKSAQTIADIQEADGKQDDKISEIEHTASGIKATVSDLSTTQEKQSGSISTLQQRAEGFEATVTKVNNLSVGSRNLYLNSRGLADGYGVNGNVKVTVEPFDSTTNMWHIMAAQGIGHNIGIYIWDYCKGKIPDNSDWSYSADVKGTGKAVTFGIERYNNKPVKGNIGSEWSRISQTGHVDYGIKTITMYFDTSDRPLDVYIKLPKLETGTMPTDWTPAPEDVDSTIAKVKLTADEASAAISKLTSADGIITKAQADIKVNADAIGQKVSKEVYDKKTGELSEKINKAKDTADKSLRTIGDYKTSNDKRVHEAESSIERTADAIKEKVSKTDYDKKTGDLTHDLSELKHTAEGFEATVTKVNNLSVGGRNLLLGTRDWTDNTRWNQRGTVTKDTYRGMVIAATTWPWNSPRYQTQHANILQVGKTYTFSTYVRNTSDTDTHVAPYCDNEIVTPIGTTTSLPAHTDWVRVSITFKCVKDSTTSAGTLRWEGIYGVKNGQIQFAGYKLEEGTIATDWSPAPEDVQSDIAQVKITADSVSSIVSDPKTGLSTRVQTAEGTLNTVKSTADGAMSKASQTANDISKEITDRKNGDSNTLQSSKDFTQSSITSAVNGVNSTITQTSDAILAKVGATNLFPNSEFTQHYGYEGSGEVHLSGGGKANVDNKYSGTVSVTTTASYWQGYWANKIPVYGGKKYSASVLVHYTNGGLSNGSAGLDIWFYDNKGVRISSASRWTSQVSSQYWVKISNEGFTAPVNAVSMQVSLLVIGAGQQAVFAQPMVTATEKLQEYTPNDDISAQLSLFKDNWSIGINDNISKITSGIVGNASQMSIISKNVKIDSPSTQITGTAWIQSAMIANGAIGSAQIGDAAITNAKIANLDVSKITGNVSNFIQSNWNGVYGSAYITS